MKKSRLIVTRRPKDFSRARREYLGGTDAAPLLGVSERKTRFQVFAEKMGALADFEMGEEAEAGVFMEPLVLRRFAARFGVTIDTRPRTYRLRDMPFVGVNPDALLLGADGKPVAVVEAKTRSPFQRGLWGEPGSSDVPPDELCQGQLYLEVLDLPTAYYPVFFDRAMTLFVVQRDRELGALILREAVAFWRDFIVPKKEPPFEGPAAAPYLLRKFPRVTEPMRDAEPEDDILVARRDLIKRHLTVLADRLVTVESALKARIGASPGLAGSCYVARWGEVKAKTTVGYKAALTELRSFPLFADEALSRTVRDAIDAAVARHTDVGEPTRALQVHFSKGPRALPPVDLEPVPANALPPAAPTAEGE